MTAQRDGLAILTFLGLTAAFSALFWTLMINAGQIGAGGGHYVEGVMWSPGIAALATVAIFRLDIGSLGLSRFGGRFAAVGYLTPLVYAAIAYGLVWTLGFGTFPDPAGIARLSAGLGWGASAPGRFVPLYFLLIGLTGMIAGTARALGEEIGWRGFLAPRLVGRWGFTGGALVSGLIWTAWHVPVLLNADYNNGTPWWFALTCFTVMVVADSVILTWLRLRSNSVWPCAILHASHNLFIQKFFTPLTGAKGTLTPYAIDEFGVAVPAVVLVFALAFWANRGRATAPAA